MRFITLLLSVLALSTWVAGFPTAQPSEGSTSPTIILTIGGGEDEPITFPATTPATSISRRDGADTTDIDIVARQRVGPGLVIEGIVNIIEYVLQRIADDKGVSVGSTYRCFHLLTA